MALAVQMHLPRTRGQAGQAWVRAIRGIWLWSPQDVLLSLCWASSPPLRQRLLILGFALCIFYSLHCHPALDFPPSPSHSLQGLSQSSRIACHPLPPQTSHVAELLIMPRQSSGVPTRCSLFAQAAHFYPL